MTNRTWQSIGLRWVQPNLDETVTLFPEQRGGLEMYVNLEKVRRGTLEEVVNIVCLLQVGQSLLPLTRPGYTPADYTTDPVTAEVPGAWDILPPVQVPAKVKVQQLKYDLKPLKTNLPCDCPGLLRLPDAGSV